MTEQCNNVCSKWTNQRSNLAHLENLLLLFVCCEVQLFLRSDTYTCAHMRLHARIHTNKFVLCWIYMGFQLIHYWGHFFVSLRYGGKSNFNLKQFSVWILVWSVILEVRIDWKISKSSVRLGQIYFFYHGSSFVSSQQITMCSIV